MGTIENKITPVLCGASFKNKGVQELLDAIVKYLPSPVDLPPVKGVVPQSDKVIELKASDEGPLCAVAFKIAQYMRLEAKRSLRLAGEDRENLNNHAEIEIPVLDRPVRNSMPNRFDWRIDVNGEQISLVLGDQCLTVDCESALTLSRFLTAGGKQAKHYAGDTSRSLSAAGILTDAEENYKIGYQ